jgi:amino acid adenylation domain-containing protein
LHRDPSRLPLTSVILNHMEHETELDFEGLELSYSYRPRAFEIFEWQVNVEMLPDGVDLQLSYNTDLFDQETIERRLEEYETLMRALVAAPDAPMDSLPLLGTAERALLDRFNDTASHSTPPEQPEGLVHERMALQVGRTPDAAAVEFEGRALSYAELDGCANRLARHLVEQGFGPGQLAAICVNRSPWMVVSLLAVLKAGGAYVPLDPGYPAARLSYILEDSEAAVMLTEGAVSGGLPKHGARTVLLDAPGLLDFGDADPLGIDVSGASIAYVIYTSGSTGKPKGVEVPHSALANFLASMAREPGLGPDDVLVAVTTLAFDIAGLELFLPLVTGAKLVLASRQVAADGESLMALLARCDATIMQATPATWRLMIEAGWAGDNGLRALCGGEAITPELVAELRPRCKELWNMYGPTETTIWSTVARLEVGEPVTIGRPIDNTQVHVLDDNMQRLPIGVTGELYIGGAGVARGYRHRPGLTAERFVRDHFGVGSTPRLYRTGDLGRYRSDGQLECLGRRDHQVKIRGYRIELGEIEAVLEQHSDVREAVVVDREDERVGRYLVAWFVSHADEPPSRRELREHLGRQLPDYMIPPVFSELDAIPRLPNGKVDRAALPRSRGSRVEVERHLAEPRDDFELRLQSLWKNVLGVESVGITDNFFDLGGHSLLAMRLLAEIEASFGISLALPRLVEAPTIEHLADLFRKGEVPAKLDELLLIREPTGGATRPPIFCICGIFLYRDLAQRMHPEHPVYAVFLQSELDLIHAGDGRAWPSTEDMAAKYLELVRRVQPEGPYFITGVSFGGVLAFEMAQQLRADGQEVGLVALLDTPCTGDKRPSIMKRAIFHARQVRQQGAEYLTRRLRLGGQDEQPLLEVEPVQVGTGAQQTKRFGSARQRLFLDAMRRYQARSYDGRIELFLASRRSEAEALLGDPMLAWRAVASGRLMVHTVPGDHLGILRAPDVEVLARKLQTSVDAVLEERAG